MRFKLNIFKILKSSVLIVSLVLTSSCFNLVKVKSVKTIESSSEKEPAPNPTIAITPPPVPTSEIPVGDISWNEDDFQHIYNVGPGLEYSDPNAVPWERIRPSSLIKIHYRATPYNSKWIMGVAATKENPVVVLGINDSFGNMPIITGENATTRRELDYWNENRSVIKIGGASSPSETPSYVVIENLDIRSAHPNYRFTDDSGNIQTYSPTAAAIHIELGTHITIKNCKLHDSGNGLFSGHSSRNILISGNYIYDNGIVGDIYHHNSYTESFGITFEFNHYGRIKSGARGNNLKDRSAGTIIRYNWIDGGNRTIDLVESDYASFYNDPTYRNTYVYGNVLVKYEVTGQNSQITHYGGDSGDYSRYRKGTLWFYNNTIVSYRSRSTLFGISSNDEVVRSFNNIIYTPSPGSGFAIMGAAGRVHLQNNWIKSGFRTTHESGLSSGAELMRVQNIEGVDPNFDTSTYKLSVSSSCVNSGTNLPGEVSNYPLLFQYGEHGERPERITSGVIDIGAFEF